MRYFMFLKDRDLVKKLHETSLEMEYLYFAEDIKLGMKCALSIWKSN